MTHRTEEPLSSSLSSSSSSTLDDDVTRVVDWLSSLSLPPPPPNDTTSTLCQSSLYEVSLDRLCHDWSSRQENDDTNHHSLSRSVAAVLFSRALVQYHQRMKEKDHTATTTIRTTTCHAVSHTVPATKSNKKNVNQNDDDVETVPCTGTNMQNDIMVRCVCVYTFIYIYI